MELQPTNFDEIDELSAEIIAGMVNDGGFKKEIDSAIDFDPELEV